jgi:hypothetical protein
MFLSIPIDQKYQILICDTVVANERYNRTFSVKRAENTGSLTNSFHLRYILADGTDEEMTLRSAISSTVLEDLLRFTTKRTTGW